MGIYLFAVVEELWFSTTPTYMAVLTRRWKYLRNVEARNMYFGLISFFFLLEKAHMLVIIITIPLRRGERRKNQKKLHVITVTSIKIFTLYKWRATGISDYSQYS